MSWFVFALIATVFFSTSVLIDERLLAGHFSKLSNLSLTTVASLAGLPFVIIFGLVIDQFPSWSIFFRGLIAGWLLVGAYQLYYQALRSTNPAIIATLFQLILPFNYLLGIIFFNESVTLLQTLGLILVASASIAVSFNTQGSDLRFRYKDLILMGVASLMVSISDAVFKNAAEDVAFSTLAFSEYASTLIIGLIVVLISKKIRGEIASLLPRIKKTYSIINLNELVNLGGVICLRYAVVIGPLALVQGMLSLQPIFILVMLLILSVIFKKHQIKPISNLFLSVSAILIAVVGSVLITI